MARKKLQRSRPIGARTTRSSATRNDGPRAASARPSLGTARVPADALPPAVRALRARMDRLNARLAADVQARARLAVEIAREKAKHGLPAADPARERDMLRRVLDEAPAGLPRCDLARVFKTLFVASRELVLADRSDPARAGTPQPSGAARRRKRSRASSERRDA